MNHILITLACCTLGPKLSSAREYVVIDVDTLQQLEHNRNTVPARRYTVNKNDALRTKKFLKSAIKTLQSYKDDELKNVISTFKNSLTNMNVNDKAFRKAKKFVLDNMLSLTNGKSGKQIKKLLNKMYQALENDEYKQVLDKNPAVYEQLMSKLIKGKEISRANSLRTENSGILGMIKSAFQQFVNYLMFNQHQPEENSVVKLAKRILKSGVSSENDQYGDPIKQKKQSSEWLKNKVVNFALNLFNNTQTPMFEGQIKLKIDGIGGDTGVKMSFR